MSENKDSLGDALSRLLYTAEQILLKSEQRFDKDSEFFQLINTHADNCIEVSELIVEFQSSINRLIKEVESAVLT